MCVLTNVHGGSEELDESECWHLLTSIFDNLTQAMT
jgi:hypothetical protein